MIWEVLFWISVAALAHTYLIFPGIMLLTGRRSKSPDNTYPQDDPDLPAVSVILAAYNEESVIARKIESTFQTHYNGRIEMLIGSDASDDQTDAIIKAYQKQYPQIRLIRFSGRTGKANIINELTVTARSPIFVLTDANVFFTPDTLYHLAKHFRDPKVGVVGGRIVNSELKPDGISYQEKTYLDQENHLKYCEGQRWGTMIGAFGGCYAMRRDLYTPVPKNYYMDDFYLSMYVLECGLKALNELDAICHEDVSNQISEEFRRKVRISIGNFQNLMRYRSLLLPWKHPALAFSFFSHKVLRWLGPFFILLALIANGMLITSNLFYQWTFFIQTGAMLLPVLDNLLKRAGVHNRFLRFVTHFYLMNLALLTGFFRYVKGVDSNIWKPTQRYQ